MVPTGNWISRLLKSSASLPRIPPGVRAYAIGDIHGRHDLMMALLAAIFADASDGRNIIIFLGDYIDRGPASRQVIEDISGFDRPGWDVVALRGNHEQVLLDFLDDPEIYRVWRPFGAPDTLLSYGVEPPLYSDTAALVTARDSLAAALPARHLDFLKNLPLRYELGDYLFVHAGVRPGVSLNRQHADDLLWIREAFLEFDGYLGKKIVHGHTPEERPVVTASRIGIDTGAYATDRLSAVVIENDGYRFLSTDSPVGGPYKG